MTLIERFENSFIPEPMSGCWLWIGSGNIHGYGQIHRNRRLVGAHRASWELYRGPIPNGLCVCHRCDTPPCVNPQHLFLGTKSDNTVDMYAKGRGHIPIAIGVLNGRAKLTPEQVTEIRALAPVVSQRRLAVRFGVARTTIQWIQNGAHWRSVPKKASNL